MRSSTLAAALASGTVAVACANAPPAPPPREAPSASAAPTPATADAGSESVPDSGVTTQRAPGGRPGHAAGKNALRQTVQYTYEEVCSEKCATYEMDAREPPWVVE